MSMVDLNTPLTACMIEPGIDCTVCPTDMTYSWACFLTMDILSDDINLYLNSKVFRLKDFMERRRR